jgi:predicted DNA-binding protein with PD1-like motif
MDIKAELTKFVRTHGLEAPFIMTCAGSVSEAKIRFAYPGDHKKGGRMEVRNS